MSLRICVLVTVLALSAPAQDSLPEPNATALKPAAIMNEATGAIMGGAVCAGVFGFLFHQMADPSTEIWKTFGGTVVGGSLGYPLLCGLGAWLGGRMSGEHGRLVPAMVGALTATPIALTVAWGAKLLEEAPKPAPTATFLYVAAALLPPAGAVVGYNWSIRNRSMATSGRFSIETPTVGLTPVAESDAVAIDLRLLRMVF